MEVSLKYAVIERERRFLISTLPAGVVETRTIVDHYLPDTRLRLREVTNGDGSVVRKLTQKVRLSSGPEEVACTNVYLSDAEWALFRGLSARHLWKVRHIVERDGYRIAIDEFEDGTLLAEIDDGDEVPKAVPSWLDATAEVTRDERWIGSELAARTCC